MKLECEIVKRISKKGKPYTAIEIKITDKIKKLVFLSAAELELIELLKK